MPGDLLAFGPFQLDPASRRLLRNGEPVPLGSRHFDLLHALVRRGGQIVSKDALIESVWRDVAVTDNSLEQAISSLRRTLGGSAGSYIETHPRRGYRLAVPVQRLAPPAADPLLDTTLAPYRIWIEGRAALETLEAAQIQRARQNFEQALESLPEEAAAHVGLANACALDFEATRLDPARDPELAHRAVHHAREACRLEPGYAEAWATLGFVLDRLGRSDDAVAALRRAVALEPDNWRHHLRLAYAGWGEERLRAARRTLALVPHFPLAHWLAASVHVARGALGEARRDLEAGLSGESPAGGRPRFGAVALHWLLGLIDAAEGDEAAAFAQFDRELRGEGGGQLYARECCANTWYAIGARHLAGTRLDLARHAFQEALERIPNHQLARAAAAVLDSPPSPTGRLTAPDVAPAAPFESVLCHAMALAARHATKEAAELVDTALTHAPPGNTGWLLPVEPMLQVWRAPDVWAAALARLRGRAT